MQFFLFHSRVELSELHLDRGAGVAALFEEEWTARRIGRRLIPAALGHCRDSE